MPQLDPTTFISQLFWLGVCFLALYIILSYIAIPKISKTLEKREETILEKINLASTYRERAEDLLADYEKILAEAREKAHERVKASAQATHTDIDRQKREFLTKVNERLHLTEQELYRARMTAGKEIASLSGDIASVLLKKLTGETYAPQQLMKKRKKA
jgi:F-type H+-transporting ATPase subunit b